ncbi:unnamed protein product [Lactuca saligna]|uniref:non-specific serine/threonine protein kinase n=1 Tax=Lactuca saligna TaxID=75948 RepID=A0AA35ZWG0_LACSI|nr:unnamed protein product [Lactuca saligna]
MASPNWVLLIIQFTILTHLSVLTITHGDSVCGTQGTYKQNSAYQKNLNDTLSSLIESHNGNGFFTAYSDSSQDDDQSTTTTYALALCPGDFDVESCLGCVKSATERIRRDCPNQKKATGWYYVLEAVGNLFKELQGKAAVDGYYRTSYSDAIILPRSTGSIQATMQCFPNISHDICHECLMNATDYLLTCCSGNAEILQCHQGIRLQFKLQIREGKNKSNVIGPAIAAATVALAISTFFIWLWVRSKKGYKEEVFDALDDDTGEIIYFRLNEMNAATSNFSVANKLGEGGFGPVFWGELSDGKKIAVKRLSHNSSQGMQEFKTEVKLIIKLQHKNLVRLLGCCMKGNERLLVYEYMSNSSLDNYLFDPKKAKELNWAKRVKIVNGIAKGLRYLHEDSRLKIIHRDLKASNVLLDEEMNPKISDFGTARIFGTNQIEANTDRVVGTYGYMAPEYAMEGLFSIKSDVYSFGVLLLEIMSGKKNNRLFHEEHDQKLLSYAWMSWKEGKAEQLIDENLKDDCPVDEALEWMRIALLCIQEDPNDRPMMSSVASMLEGEWKIVSEPKPPMSFGQFIASDHSSSTWNADDSGFYSSNETTHEHQGKSSESNQSIDHGGLR